MSLVAEPILQDDPPDSPEPDAGRIRRAGLRGIGWTSLAQLVGMAIKLASNLILTRLLAPEAYGLFGTAMAVVTTLEWLSDLGIQPALVRLPRGASPSYLRTGWWLGFGRGVGLSLVAAMLSWPLSKAYGRPELFPILLALAARPALYALRSPGMPALRKRLDYRAIFVDEVVQIVVGTGLTIALAWVAPSPGVIVAGTLAGAGAGVVISYILCPMTPRRDWDPEAALGIAHLGRQVFVNTLVMALWLNLDRLLGLRLATEAQMGLYAVAWNLAAVAEGLVTRACDVYYSMLARRDGPEAQAAWHREVCGRVVSWGMPLMALGVVAAPATVRLLYDSRYAGAAPLLALLAARLMVRTLGQVQFQYLLALGEVRSATRAYVVALVVQAASLVPLAHAMGVAGLAMAGLLSTAALTATQSVGLARRGDPSLRQFGITTAWMVVALTVAWNCG